MRNVFKQSLGIRHLVCGSCNACEHEMNALTNPFYDITQEGWDVVASPRHADIISVTGPMTSAMREAAERTIAAAPQPCSILAVGDCAAGEGPWAGAPEAGIGAGVELGATVMVRGCPPTPEAIREGLREASLLIERGSKRTRVTRAVPDDAPLVVTSSGFGKEDMPHTAGVDNVRLDLP